MDEFLKDARTHVALKLLFAGISIAMLVITIGTSLESNLLEVWNDLGQIPWMRATLWDFYFNITLFSVWVIYKEQKISKAILWVFLFIVLGSMATAFYAWLQAIKLQNGESAANILLRKS